MSLEVLKIIILACQVSGGEGSYSTVARYVDEYQAKCQKKLIECHRDSRRHQSSDFQMIEDCLMRR